MLRASGKSPVKARLYYKCRLRLKATVMFVIWYTDDRDGFVRDEGGRLLVAQTAAALAEAAKAQEIDLVKNETAEYDFDRIRAWCLAPDSAGIDYSGFLNAWNFFDDLAGLSDSA